LPNTQRRNGDKMPKKKQNYFINIDLSVFISACRRKFKTVSGEELDCIVIPIERNGIVVSEETGGLYFSAMAREQRLMDYGTTHVITRHCHSKEGYKELMKRYKTLPIIGEMKPISYRESDGALVLGHGYVPSEDPRNIEKKELKLKNEMLKKELDFLNGIEEKEEKKVKTKKESPKPTKPNLPKISEDGMEGLF
jgi:hypothetical protein